MFSSYGLFFLWYQYFQILSPKSEQRTLKSNVPPLIQEIVLDLQLCACLYFSVLDTEREKILVFPYQIYVSLDIRQASPFPIRCTIVYWAWCFSPL